MSHVVAVRILSGHQKNLAADERGNGADPIIDQRKDEERSAAEANDFNLKLINDQ